MKYNQYLNSFAWKIISGRIDDLVKNGDVIEQTAREYIVGYLVEGLFEHRVVNSENAFSSSKQIIAEVTNPIGTPKSLPPRSGSDDEGRQPTAPQ